MDRLPEFMLTLENYICRLILGVQILVLVFHVDMTARYPEMKMALIKSCLRKQRERGLAQREWTIQHVLFPSKRLFLKPSKSMATDGTFVQCDMVHVILFIAAGGSPTRVMVTGTVHRGAVRVVLFIRVLFIAARHGVTGLVSSSVEKLSKILERC